MNQIHKGIEIKKEATGGYTAYGKDFKTCKAARKYIDKTKNAHSKFCKDFNLPQIDKATN